MVASPFRTTKPIEQLLEQAILSNRSREQNHTCCQAQLVVLPGPDSSVVSFRIIQLHPNHVYKLLCSCIEKKKFKKTMKIRIYQIQMFSSRLRDREDEASALQSEDCGFDSRLWSLCYSLQQGV